jgi:hypothetical protein
MGAIVSLITALGPVALQAVLPAILPDNSSVLKLLQEIVPRIPKWIETGTATVALYDNVMTVIRENRPPTSAEWDALEASIAADQAVVRDKSRDV